MLIEPLALDTAVAGFNGGVYVDPKLKILDQRILDPDAAREALKVILDGGLDAWLYTGEDWLIRDPKAPHVAREALTVQVRGEGGFRLHRPASARMREDRRRLATIMAGWPTASRPHSGRSATGPPRRARSLTIST